MAWPASLGGLVRTARWCDRWGPTGRLGRWHQPHDGQACPVLVVGDALSRRVRCSRPASRPPSLRRQARRDRLAPGRCGPRRRPAPGLGGRWAHAGGTRTIGTAAVRGLGVVAHDAPERRLCLGLQGHTARCCARGAVGLWDSTPSTGVPVGYGPRQDAPVPGPRPQRACLRFAPPNPLPTGGPTMRK